MLLSMGLTTNYCAACDLLFFYLQGVDIVNAAAGVSQSIFISDEGVGYWCGEGMGELKQVRQLV